MPCGHTATSKCVVCVTTPAALAARAQLSGLTIHASAARPRTIDINAAAHQLRLKASKSQYGLQLHGRVFDETVAHLKGLTAQMVNDILVAAGLNVETRTALKVELYG